MKTAEPPAWAPEDLARWAGGAWLRPPAAPPRGVSSDTRTLVPGNLYVALRGERFDGHAFVAEALERGASAALVEAARARAFGSAAPLLAVDDTRAALARLAAGHRATLGARFLAITGSVGKTTVKELLADALAAGAPTFRSPGNWNNDLGLPLSLLRMGADHAFGVLELGMNRPGEIDALTRLLRPHAGVVTAIGPAHLAAFTGEEAIVREKADLFRGLPADGWAVAALENPGFDTLRRAAPCRLVTTSTSRGAAADYTVVRRGRGVFEVRETASGEEAAFEAALPGRYFVEDALLAIAAARRAGVSWPALQAAVGGYRPPPMRWERSRIAGVEIINDAYNANPLSMREALRAFEETPVRGGRWLVLGGMRELGSGSDALHRDLGRDLAAGAWAGLVTCGDGGALIAEGARAGGFEASRMHACADPESAADVLRGRVTDGDAVLLKASRGEQLERVLAAWSAAGRPGDRTPCGVTGGDG